MSAAFMAEPNIGRILGFKNPESVDEFELAKKVERGIAVSTVANVAKCLAPGDRKLAYRIVPKTTLERRRDRKAPLTKDESETVVALARVAVAVERAFGGDKAKAGRFLSRPHPVLEQRTPLDVAIGSVIGAELVIDMVERARAGIAL